MDPGGNAIAVCWSTSSNYPTHKAYQAVRSGPADAVITKFSSSDDGSKVVFPAYFGGSGFDFAEDVTVDAQGFIFVTVSMSSRDFPITPGARPMRCEAEKREWK
ncbi:MAG: hypothetical protein ACI8XZ_005013 [Gammaproteobacteria bacterium]|jgi:hypothetical protein